MQPGLQPGQQRSAGAGAAGAVCPGKKSSLNGSFFRWPGRYWRQAVAPVPAGAGGRRGQRSGSCRKDQAGLLLAQVDTVYCVVWTLVQYEVGAVAARQNVLDEIVVVNCAPDRVGKSFGILVAHA